MMVMIMMMIVTMVMMKVTIVMLTKTALMTTMMLTPPSRSLFSLASLFALSVSAVLRLKLDLSKKWNKI